MSLILSTASPTLTFPSVARYPHASPSPSPLLSRLCKGCVSHGPALFDGCRIQAPFVVKERGGALVVKAAPDVDADPPSGSEGEEEEVNLPFQDLPLESKLQLKLEQKMRMKITKKVRLRRKKLMRKRRLRKKGRWPPSKLKKNKNV